MTEQIEARECDLCLIMLQAPLSVPASGLKTHKVFWLRATDPNRAPDRRATALKSLQAINAAWSTWAKRYTARLIAE